MTSTFLTALVYFCIPLEQGLRQIRVRRCFPYLVFLYSIRTRIKTKRPRGEWSKILVFLYSIRTRIKTAFSTGEKIPNSLYFCIPLEQGLRQARSVPASNLRERIFVFH